MKNFFCSDTTVNESQNIMQLCTSLKCRIADPFSFNFDDDVTETAFLGAGTFGRVFRVIPDTIDSSVQVKGIDDLQAMKVCRMEHVQIIEKEHSILFKHAESCKCDLLVRPVSNLIIVRSDLNLCGYVMQPVGDRLKY